MQGWRASGQSKFLQTVHDRGGVIEQRLPRHDSGQDNGHRNVKNGANDQRGNDSDGQVSLRIARFLGGGRYRIEADVGEKNDRAASENTRPSLRREGMPVARTDVMRSGDDECKNGGDFQNDHGVVGFRRLADAAHQDHGQNHHYDKCGEVETEMQPRCIEHVPF